MTSVVNLRLSGDADAVAAVAAMLTAAGFDPRLGERIYPDRNSFGVRAYGEIAVADAVPVSRGRGEP
ncbi:hypothetical protein IU459_18475 [Nocardia amamiensis]|uniref:Uncharacterized protein n=1 Tax=Nocardia amamiensis TaxID=404578 RepID=A0ABS0CSG8_9NOCA|nr:hypothetical protein [Nocardia amamiensis]MBF6299512.1 hypothetical protein [Nocardia amamiensis]